MVVQLVSSTGRRFPIEPLVAFQSPTIKLWVKAYRTQIVNTFFDYKIVEMVANYMIRHSAAAPPVVGLPPAIYGDSKAEKQLKAIIADFETFSNLPTHELLMFCKHRVEAIAPAAADGAGGDEELHKYDADFVKVIDMETLHDLLMAAYYFKIDSLLDLICKAALDKFRSASEEFRLAVFADDLEKYRCEFGSA